ncbi:MAG: M56 family metallopeptidase [Pseudomonadota bacterium]
MKPVLDIVIDANVVFLVAFGFWGLTHAALSRSWLRADYALQLRLLRAVLLVVILSPLLSFLAVTLSQSLWPKAPITVSDVAVAAYLRGEIAMPAVQFEELLNTRNRWLDMVLSGQLPWLTALLALLVIGSLALLVQTTRTILHINRIVAQSFVWRRTRSTDVRLSDTVSVPFAARGLFRRHVVLPSHLLTQPHDMRIVMAHEFEHLRQGDVEWELAFEFLRPFLYWNPVFLLWKRTFGRLRELCCDRAVLQSARITPREYAQCLLTFCRRDPSGQAVARLNVAFVRTGTRSARSALEARVLALQHTHQMPRRHVLFGGLAVILSLAIVLTAASVRNPGDWSQDRLMLSTVVNLERFRAHERGF